MITSLIVCEAIRFDPEKRSHYLGKVLNEQEVVTFPAILELHALAKIFDFKEEGPHEIELQFMDDQQRIKGSIEKRTVHNQRSAEKISGVDINFVVKALVVKQSNYRLRLYIDGQHGCDYPIHVRKADSKEE